MPLKEQQNQNTHPAKEMNNVPMLRGQGGGGVDVYAQLIIHTLFH